MLIESELSSLLYFQSVYPNIYHILRLSQEYYTRYGGQRSTCYCYCSNSLSLAVEVSNLDDFNGSTDDVVYFLQKKLDYLVSSRPTAVNLSDAATKLKEITLKAAATTSEAKGVFQAYVEASEIMLGDDVASNKAIGTYRAKFIQNHTDKQKLSILTHCNTGSLATAGYGTTLGVIRALNSGGVLERAYCTETRPFNQEKTLVVENVKISEKYDHYSSQAARKDGRENVGEGEGYADQSSPSSDVETELFIGLPEIGTRRISPKLRTN